MKFFGGSVITGERLHSSLKIYIECFHSPPFPKMFPRGGGIWDQDPILIADFRVIAKFERQNKEEKEQIREAQSGGAGGGLGGMLDEFIKLNELEDQATF